MENPLLPLAEKGDFIQLDDGRLAGSRPGGGGGAGNSADQKAVRQNHLAIVDHRAPWHDPLPLDKDFTRQYWVKDTEDWAARRIKEHNKENPSAPIKATAAEAAHVVLYSESSFWSLNKGLREGKLSAPLKKHAEILNQTLDKFPKFVGKVQRGADLPDRVLKMYAAGVGKVIEERGFLSTSSDGRQAAAFKGNAKFVIKSKNGRAIDGVSKEWRQKEVLFKSSTKFKITKVQKATGKTRKHVITLEEV